MTRSQLAAWFILASVALAATAMAQQAEPVFYHVHEPTSFAKLNLMIVSIFAMAWVFVLGACIGSFLNVVIYRLPAGLKLGKPKSRCPKCETPLAARDNIPIFGWLILRGKCRYCREPISSRYPIIELTAGIIFLGLMMVEVATGGANLPLRPVTPFGGNPIDMILMRGEWGLLGIYLFHCCCLILILATAMIGYDGHQPPARLLLFGVLVAGICGAVWPALRPVAAIAPVPEWLQQMYWGFEWTMPGRFSRTVHTTGIGLTGLIDVASGLSMGLVVGRILTWPYRDPSLQPVASAMRHSCLLLGAFLGWQAVGSIAVLAIVPLLIIRFTRSAQLLKLSPLALLITAVVFTVFWRQLDAAAWMIGHTGWTFTAVGPTIDWTATLLLLFGLVWLSGAIGSDIRDSQQTESSS